jgi:hypothetical protein
MSLCVWLEPAVCCTDTVSEHGWGAVGFVGEMKPGSVWGQLLGAVYACACIWLLLLLLLL